MSRDAPLSNPSEADLGNAVQENLYALFRAMAHGLSGAELVERAGLSYHHSFPTNPMFNGAGVASLYAVGVVPAARGKGIGGAITLKPLLEARDLGYRYAVLFSTEMAKSVYERIGFRFTGTSINRYLWRNG